MTTLTVRS